MNVRAVIFDLDGTLTVPLLDFEAMAREIGISPGLPILEQLTAGDENLRRRAEAVIRRHELEAIERATLADGCVELLARLREKKLPHGILTRNTRQAVDLFVRRFGFVFDGVFTREDGPHKPSPAGVLSLCQRFSRAPSETLMVGDYKFDVMAGRDAGCPTVLVKAPPPEELQDWGPPDHVIASLRELLPWF